MITDMVFISSKVAHLYYEALQVTLSYKSECNQRYINM